MTVMQHAAQLNSVWQAASHCKPVFDLRGITCAAISTQSSPLSPFCRQDSLEKIARSFLGFDAIIQQEGLAPPDAEVGAAMSWRVWSSCCLLCMVCNAHAPALPC